MANDVCVGCLGSRVCWICLGTGFAAPARLRGVCPRCHGSRRCHLCAGIGAAAAATYRATPRRVLVVDDEQEVLDLARIWLEDDERCSLVETALNGDAALVWLADDCADTIICDYRLGAVTSDHYLPAFHSACPGARIVIHTSDPDLAMRAGVIEHGASVVLEKGRTTFQELLDIALAPKN